MSKTVTRDGQGNIVQVVEHRSGIASFFSGCFWTVLVVFVLAWPASSGNYWAYLILAGVAAWALWTRAHR